MSGSGGTRAGSGGASGTGGAPRIDAGVVDCVQTASDYRSAIFNAKPCGPGLTCDKPRPTALCSGACTTFVSVTTNVDMIQDRWTAGNCAATAPPCTGTDACTTPPTSAYCMAVGFTSTGDCKDGNP